MRLTVAGEIGRRQPTAQLDSSMTARIPSAAAFLSAPQRGQHHAELRGVRLPCDEKASSGLPLQPTDLPLLLTEQIAHLRPFPIVFAWEIAREAKTPQTRHAASASPGTMLSSAQFNGHIGHVG